jgi:aryl-alcohol dehydrogenase-like predicted oxidoreductase
VPLGVLGRTNAVFPPVWISLAAPQTAFVEGWRERLVSAALDAKTVIDVSKGPALWGGAMRGTEALLMSIGGTEIESATDEQHASDLVQAHLIETLSAVGRDYLDFYFLQVRRALEEFQINGALQALEMARQEGHIRHVGLCCDGSSLAVLGMWQFHDAFDVLLVPRNHLCHESYDTLAPLAQERRVGVITSRPLNWGHGMPFVKLPTQWKLRNLTKSFYGLSLAQAAIADLAKDSVVLVGVRTVEEIEMAVAAPGLPLPDGLDAMFETYREAWESDAEWELLLTDNDPIARKAAERRLRAI